MIRPLKQMWAQQTLLVDKYVEKGKQENYPMSLEDKKGQAFIRELFGFLEEEMFEAFEHIQDMGVVMHNALPSSLGTKGTTDYLKNFNEEVADTMAFWIEIFMYIGYDESTIQDYYSTILEQIDNLHLDKGPDVMATAIEYSKMILGHRHQVNHERLKIASFNLVIENNMHNHNENELPGNWISDDVVNISQEYLFHSVKHLNIARNCLKMKFWRESDNSPNYQKFYNNLMEAWLNYQVFLYAAGYTLSTQYSYNFKLKNDINMERIKTKW